MARMVPFPMMPTESSAERQLYEGFMEQLDESYVVFHSVDWVLAGTAGRQEIGEADFVIAHPDDGLLVLEAKGGELAYDPASKRWTQGGRSGRHRLDEDPFHQAVDEWHSLTRILQAQPGWEEWRPNIGYGVAFPQTIYAADAHPDAPARLAIDRDDLHRLAERIREIQRQWVEPNRTFGERGIDALETALGLRVEIAGPLRETFGREDHKIMELTTQQAYARAFVMHRNRAVVTGPPGSGKTVLALGVARHVAAAGRHTLLACVHEDTAERLRASAHDLANLDVGTVESVVAGEPQPRYDAMVVDEAHDVDEASWPPLLALHRDPEHGTLYLFADDSVEAEPLPTDVTAGSRHDLPRAGAIAEFVSVLYDPDAEKENDKSKETSGGRVDVFDYEDPDGLVRLAEIVLANLTARGLRLQDIVMLTPMGSDESALWAARRIGRFTLSDSDELDTVRLSTVDEYSGPARSSVILAEVSDSAQTAVQLAASFATDHLIVLATPTVAQELRRKVRRV
jgi:AAA domain/Nuclease-related domain